MSNTDTSRTDTPVKKLVYSQIPAIQALNQVPGFDPTVLLIQLDTNEYYLPVQARLLWFRLKYPTGRIVKNYLQLNDAAAVVEAQIFPDAEAENCIATGIARRVSQNDDIYGERYVECAEIAAVGRALAEAGFGTQLCDIHSDYEDLSDLADAPVSPPQSAAPKNNHPAAPTENRSSAASQITVKEAACVVIPFGNHAGKTLGQLAKEAPNELGWYANQYRGANSKLRTAAKILIDMALKDKAS